MVQKKSEQPITRETVKQVEAKAYDIKRSTPLKFRELSGYFLRNDVKLTQEVNFFTINSEKNFEAVLGIARLMENNVTPFDLRKNIVVVIAMKPSRTEYDIKIYGVYLIDSDIYINYEIIPKSIPDIGFFITNMKAVEIERPQSITNVSFANQNKVITVIPFGARTAGSPANISDMTKYYTGTYKGTIPAADGPGIVTVLTLSPDYTFTLEQSYLNRPDRVFTSSGKWAPTEDVSSFVLNYDKGQTEQSRFYFIDRNTVEKLDQYGEKINSEFYKLKK